MKLTTQLSQRIDLLRILLVLGIVLIHIPPSVLLPLEVQYSSNFILFYKIITEKTFFRAAVPTLSVVSGFLFFLNFEAKGYVKSIQSKLISLALPLLLWNIPFWISVWWIQSYLSLGHSFRIALVPFEAVEHLNAVIGITSSPINFPLGFLRDLFVCCLISPILYALLKKAPLIGFVALAVIVYNHWHQPWISRESILLGFYLGGLLFYHAKNLDWVDNFKWLWLSLFSMASLWVSFEAMRHVYEPEYTGLGQWINVLRLLGLPAFWALSGLLLKERVGRVLRNMSHYSFFIFCAHAPLYTAVWLLWKVCIGDETTEMYTLFALLSFPCVLIMSVYLYKIIGAVQPSLLYSLIGKRKPIVDRPVFELSKKT